MISQSGSFPEIDFLKTNAISGGGGTLQPTGRMFLPHKLSTRERYDDIEKAVPIMQENTDKDALSAKADKIRENILRTIEQDTPSDYIEHEQSPHFQADKYVKAESGVEAALAAEHYRSCSNTAPDNTEENNLPLEQTNDPEDIYRSAPPPTQGYIQHDTRQFSSETEGNEQEEAERTKQREKAKRKRLRRTHIDSILYDISYYGYIASWIFLVLFIISKFINLPLVSLIGVIGSIISIASSLIASETIERRRRSISGIRWAIISSGALLLAVTGLIGIAASSPDITAAGVIGLFLWSFAPSLIDFTKRQRDDYKSYEYDDDGNVIGGGEDDSTGDYRYVHSGSSGGYNVINEIFGIPQPQDPPPIEISRDDIDNEYDDKHILNMEVIMPQTIEGDVIVVPASHAKEQNGNEKNDIEKDGENDDTL